MFSLGPVPDISVYVPLATGNNGMWGLGLYSLSRTVEEREVRGPKCTLLAPYAAAVPLVKMAVRPSSCALVRSNLRRCCSHISFFLPPCRITTHTIHHKTIQDTRDRTRIRRTMIHTTPGTSDTQLMTEADFQTMNPLLRQHLCKTQKNVLNTTSQDLQQRRYPCRKSVYSWDQDFPLLDL